METGNCSIAPEVGAQGTRALRERQETGVVEKLPVVTQRHCAWLKIGGSKVRAPQDTRVVPKTKMIATVSLLHVQQWRDGVTKYVGAHLNEILHTTNCELLYPRSSAKTTSGSQV